ncbi:MAG: hypothetical protein M3332_09005 [Actinomycetota bacterium]|nr:hypothetical protein [Actinomycetota bacterium]
MALAVLASSTCDDGDCPTFFLIETTGDVTVRGYNPPGYNPTHLAH